MDISTLTDYQKRLIINLEQIVEAIQEECDTDIAFSYFVESLDVFEVEEKDLYDVLGILENNNNPIEF